MTDGLPGNRYEAVLFDVDGTLVDSVEMIVCALGDTFEAYSELPPSPAKLRSLIGMPLHQQFSQYTKPRPSEETLGEMINFALERFEVHRHRERWFDAAIEALRVCHSSGTATALVTSKNQVELAAFLPKFPGTPYVTATVCASDVSHPKPNPESALLACKRLGVPPQRSVMVGDSVFDLRCARDAGLDCIAVTYGAGSREALIAERPNAVFDSPNELLAWTQSAFLEPTCAEKP